jgi:hypothetical protein
VGFVPARRQTSKAPNRVAERADFAVVTGPWLSPVSPRNSSDWDSPIVISPTMAMPVGIPMPMRSGNFIVMLIVGIACIVTVAGQTRVPGPMPRPGTA